MKKLTVIHRPVAMPSDTLISPKYTAIKMANSACRLCDPPSRVNLTRHHLIPEHWFLRQPLPIRQIRNAHANIAPLCRWHHDLVESKSPAVRLEARRRLRATLTQEEVTFIIQILSKEWLDAEYPS